MVTLIGNLATDVELREVGDGKQRASFLLAVDRPAKDEADFVWVDGLGPAGRDVPPVPGQGPAGRARRTAAQPLVGGGRQEAERRRGGREPRAVPDARARRAAADGTTSRSRRRACSRYADTRSARSRRAQASARSPTAGGRSRGSRAAARAAAARTRTRRRPAPACRGRPRARASGSARARGRGARPRARARARRRAGRCGAPDAGEEAERRRARSSAAPSDALMPSNASDLQPRAARDPRAGARAIRRGRPQQAGRVEERLGDAASSC